MSYANRYPPEDSERYERKATEVLSLVAKENTTGVQKDFIGPFLLGGIIWALLAIATAIREK